MGFEPLLSPAYRALGRSALAVDFGLASARCLAREVSSKVHERAGEVSHQMFSKGTTDTRPPVHPGGGAPKLQVRS